MPTFSYTSGNPNNLIAGGNASMSDMQGPLTDLRTFVNGGIGTSNLSSTAGVLESQLASAGSGLAKGAFSAYRNAASSLTTGSVVVFDAEDFDVSSWFDITTGRFTPQLAGYYRLAWSIRVQGTTLASDKFWVATLRKNGVSVKIGMLAWQRGASGVNSGGTGIVSANGSTDFFDVIIEHDHGAAAPLQTGSAQTYFAGELIGRA